MSRDFSNHQSLVLRFSFFRQLCLPLRWSLIGMQLSYLSKFSHSRNLKRWNLPVAWGLSLGQSQTQIDPERNYLAGGRGWLWKLQKRLALTGQNFLKSLFRSFPVALASVQKQLYSRNGVCKWIVGSLCFENFCCFKTEYWAHDTDTNAAPVDTRILL